MKLDYVKMRRCIKWMILHEFQSDRTGHGSYFYR